MTTLEILLTGSLIFNLLLLIRIQRLRRDVWGVRESAKLSEEELEQLKERVGKIKRLN